MFNFITKWFKKEPTAKQRIQAETTKQVTMTVANKQPFYHEMIGQSDGSRIVRVYNRKTSEMVETITCKNKEEAIDASLVLLAKYNKGVQ